MGRGALRGGGRGRGEGGLDSISGGAVGGRFSVLISEFKSCTFIISKYALIT